MSKLGKKELVAIGSSIGLIIAVIVGVTMENKPLDTASLEQYEVYRGYSEEYKAVCNDYYKDSLKAGRTNEDACRDAIGKTQVYILDDLRAFSVKYCQDINANGIYDGVESGEVTLEEINKKFGME